MLAAVLGNVAVIAYHGVAPFELGVLCEAWGIDRREHGVPVMPTGWLYTRGLLPTYTVAASFAALGRTDFAARLPSVLAGTALVPVMFALGRTVVGRAGGVKRADYLVLRSLMPEQRRVPPELLRGALDAALRVRGVLSSSTATSRTT